MKSISFDRKMRYVAMAMAVAAGISSVAVPVYAAPAENTVATDNTDKKEAEAVTDATAEVKENTEVKDSAEAPAEDTVRSRWMASRPTDETVEKWVNQYNGKTIVSVEVSGASDDIINAANVAVRSKAGDMFSVKLLERDLNRLYDTGYFYDLYPAFVEVPEGVKVTYNVLETPIVTSVELTGNSEIESTEKLMEAVTIKPGQRLNRRILHENVVAIQQVYIKDDYVMAKVHDLDVKEDGKLVLRVNEGILEGIKVKGNKKTKDYVIIREVRSKVGKPLNRKEVTRSYQRINNLGFFETVDVKPAPGVEPNAFVLEIDVKERNTGTFGIGAGYSSSDGVVGMISLGDRNFRGTGDAVSISLEISGRDTDARGFTFSYTHPWLDSKQTSLNFQIYNRRYRYNDYDTHGDLVEEYMRNRKGFEFTLGRPQSEYTTNYLTFRNRKDEYVTYKSGDYNRSGDRNISPSNVYDFSDPYGDKWREDNFGLTRSIIWSHATDTRDNYMYPTSGHRANWSIEYAGLGGKFKYQKYSISESRFYKVGTNNVVALRLEYGHSPQRLSESAQFRVGGQNTIRGYRDDQFRGDGMFVGNLEYRFPVNNIIKGAVFTDFGGAWSGGWAPKNLKASIGFGIALETPMGPLRLDLGHGSQGNRVHFNIGNTF